MTLATGVSRRSAGARALCLHVVTIPPGLWPSSTPLPSPAPPEIRGGVSDRVQAAALAERVGLLHSSQP